MAQLTGLQGKGESPQTSALCKGKTNGSVTRSRQPGEAAGAVRMKNSFSQAVVGRRQPLSLRGGDVQSRAECSQPGQVDGTALGMFGLHWLPVPRLAMGQGCFQKASELVLAATLSDEGEAGL